MGDSAPKPTSSTDGVASGSATPSQPTVARMGTTCPGRTGVGPSAPNGPSSWMSVTVTGADTVPADTAPSLSCAVADTVCTPHVENEVWYGFVVPAPPSKDQVNPAVVSAVEGSVATPVNVTGSPTRAEVA